MEKINSLLPSLREKKRYVAFEVLNSKDISAKTIRKLIEDSCISYLGELNYGKSGIMFLDDSFKDNKGILRVNNNNVNDLKACLSLIKEKNVRSLGTSGMINKVEALIAS